MTIKDIHPMSNNPKVRFLLNSFSVFADKNTEQFKSELEFKEKGTFKTSMSNKEYYIVVAGEYAFFGPEYDCQGCGERHRRIVLEITDVEDYTSQILKVYKSTGKLPTLSALCDWLISLNLMKKEWYEQEVKATEFLIKQKYPEYAKL